MDWRRVPALLVVSSSLLWIAMSPAIAGAEGGVSGWRQSGFGGFGQAENHTVGALEPFGIWLFAGTENDSGAQVWRTSNGTTWSQFTPGFGTGTVSVSDELTFGQRLYLAAGGVAAGEIWRTDGTSWQRVVAAGFGDPDNYGVSALALFGDALYAATANVPPAIGGTGSGVEIWRSATGSSGSWSQVNVDGFAASPTWPEVVMDSFGGYLYVGISRVKPQMGSQGELWRSADGTLWLPVFQNGLGKAQNGYVTSLAEHQGSFYVGLRNEDTGGEVWRSSNGTDFAQVFTGGLGTPANSRPYGLFGFRNEIYAVICNLVSGAEVWRSANGSTWSPVMRGGWAKGSNNGFADYFDRAAAVYADQLYIGTINGATGGEVWQLLPERRYLPMMVRRR